MFVSQLFSSLGETERGQSSRWACCTTVAVMKTSQARQPGMGLIYLISYQTTTPIINHILNQTWCLVGVMRKWHHQTGADIRKTNNNKMASRTMFNEKTSSFFIIISVYLSNISGAHEDITSLSSSQIDIFDELSYTEGKKSHKEVTKNYASLERTFSRWDIISLEKKKEKYVPEMQAENG